MFPKKEERRWVTEPRFKENHRKLEQRRIGDFGKFSLREVPSVKNKDKQNREEDEVKQFRPFKGGKFEIQEKAIIKKRL